MRYCPNIPCPHRLRVGTPAEFLDHVVRCSDCSTRLVASEDDAIAGRQAITRDPYRAAGPVLAADDDETPAPRLDDRAQGSALIIAGLLLAAIARALHLHSGTTMILAWGPILYGTFCLMRWFVAREKKD